MLVLTRRKDQDIVITLHGEQIVVKVTQVTSGKCRLGISAPNHAEVLRREIYNLRRGEEVATDG